MEFAHFVELLTLLQTSLKFQPDKNFIFLSILVIDSNILSVPHALALVVYRYREDTATCDCLLNYNLIWSNFIYYSEMNRVISP